MSWNCVTYLYLGPVVSSFGKFYLLGKSGNPCIWLGNLATYPTDKIYQKVEQPILNKLLFSIRKTRNNNKLLFQSDYFNLNIIVIIMKNYNFINRYYKHNNIIVLRVMHYFPSLKLCYINIISMNKNIFYFNNVKIKLSKTPLI